jgi:hypothetical protein
VQNQEEFMSRSRTVVFTARVAALAGAVAVTIAVPLFGTSSVSGADPTPPPSTSTSATTNGHGWIG